MPLPLFIGIGAAIAAGFGAGVAAGKAKGKNTSEATIKIVVDNSASHDEDNDIEYEEIAEYDPAETYIPLLESLLADSPRRDVLITKCHSAIPIASDSVSELQQLKEDSKNTLRGFAELLVWLEDHDDKFMEAEGELFYILDKRMTLLNPFELMDIFTPPDDEDIDEEDMLDDDDVHTSYLTDLELIITSGLASVVAIDISKPQSIEKQVSDKIDSFCNDLCKLKNCIDSFCITLRKAMDMGSEPFRYLSAFKNAGATSLNITSSDIENYQKLITLSDGIAGICEGIIITETIYGGEVNTSRMYLDGLDKETARVNGRIAAIDIITEAHKKSAT